MAECQQLVVDGCNVNNIIVMQSCPVQFACGGDQTKSGNSPPPPPPPPLSPNNPSSSSCLRLTSTVCIKHEAPRSWSLLPWSRSYQNGPCWRTVNENYALLGIILFLYGTTSLVLRFVTRGTELGDRLVKFSNHFRVMIDGTVCLLMMFVAVWYGNQAVKLLGKNQRLFRPVTVRLSTDITQQQQQKQKQKQRKTARTEKKCRTRRQQIVSAWIIHIRQVVISILLLFLTVFSYSLLENGNKGALSYYIHNLLMTGFELCSIYNMLKIAEGSEISRWFSWAGWVRIFTGVEAGVENMKKKTMRVVIASFLRKLNGKRNRVACYMCVLILLFSTSELCNQQVQIWKNDEIMLQYSLVVDPQDWRALAT